MCVFPLCSQYLDDNDGGESEKFLTNGAMKKKKFDEYHQESVRGRSRSLVLKLHKLVKVKKAAEISWI